MGSSPGFAISLKSHISWQPGMCHLWLHPCSLPMRGHEMQSVLLSTHLTPLSCPHRPHHHDLTQVLSSVARITTLYLKRPLNLQARCYTYYQRYFSRTDLVMLFPYSKFFHGIFPFLMRPHPPFGVGSHHSPKAPSLQQAHASRPLKPCTFSAFFSCCSSA